MQGNSEKFHLILSTNEPENTKIGESLTKSISCEKLLGVKMILSFHLTNISKQFVKQDVIN